MDKTELNLSNLKNSIDALQECIIAYKKTEDETIKGFIKDSCVKRFEFTVETSWKIMKKFLKLEYGKTDLELTMNNIFRFMEGYGFISSWEVWKNYYNNRNNTSHEYNQQKAEQILEVMEQLLNDAKMLYDKLANVIGE